MFTQQDLELLAKKGISPEKAEEQLASIAKGFPFLPLKSAASLEYGILAVDEDEATYYEDLWTKYLAADKQILKFVPASGAASRMFKNLFEFVGADYDVPTTDFEKKFFGGIRNFAFYDALDAACQKNEGRGIDALVAEGKYKAVVENLLQAKGLNYGNLPKGLLLFHKSAGAVRAALEEHLVEGALYAANGKGRVNLHFTVSPEHVDLFKALTAEKVPAYEKRFGVTYNISFSVQKASTDTIAAALDGSPFRDAKGQLLFRPGGHGALIENLNEQEADVIFIKNIDNVVPDKLKPETVKYKKIIGGVLVSLQQKCFSYLLKLESGKYTHEQLIEMLYFLQEKLFIKNPETKLLEDSELALYIKKKLNRPLRVCGMVKNVGEPGGGPFITGGNDGLFAFRDYRMTNAEGETLMTGTTYWPMIDYTTRRPIRLKEAMATYEYHQEEATNHSVLDRLRLPDMSNPDGQFEQLALYSLIDHAQHVNNSEYVRLVFDSLMQTEFDIDKPFSLEMNYQHETQPNDMLSVLRKQDNGATFVQISNSHGLSVAAKIALFD